MSQSSASPCDRRCESGSPTPRFGNRSELLSLFSSRVAIRVASVWAPLAILTCRYEDLVREPEPRIREVLGFLGLPWEPACLDFWKSERVAFTPSQDQVREPLRRSIGRWRRFEKLLELARRHLEELGIACGDR